jgi:DNA-binding MarR family transcriptional regulator
VEINYLCKNMSLKKLLSEISRNDLDEVLFSALRSVHKFERAKVTKFDLNYEAIFLLQFLRRHSPAKMSEIADEMNIPVSTATRVVDRIESRGLISRRQDRKDKRIMLVSLRATGKKIVQAVEEDTFEIITKNLEMIEDGQIQSFIETAVYLEKILKVPTDKESILNK